jgi:hypothetical protein
VSEKKLAQKMFVLTGTFLKLDWVPVTMDRADRLPTYVRVTASAHRIRSNWPRPLSTKPHVFTGMIGLFDE